MNNPPRSQQPSPTDEVLSTDELKKYFAHDLGWGWGHQSKIVFDFLCRAAGEAKGGVVLDAGAGHQRYRPFFSDAIYLAQEHPVAGEQNKGIVEYDILSDVKEIPLKDASVDLVLSTSSLEHLEYPDAFFMEAYRVLRPGGALFINVPFVYFEHEIPYDFQRPTRYGLQRYYRHAGFERISVSPTSSSISTAQYFFLEAIQEDAARLGRALWAKVLRRSLFPVARLTTRLVARLLDSGPHEDTLFPVGWVARGYKWGDRLPGPLYATKHEYLEGNALLDDEIRISDGHLLSTSRS